MDILNWIVKYNPPSKFDLYERGTVIQVILDTEGDTIKFDLYVQTSPSKESPKWVEMSIVTLRANFHHLHSKKYVDDLLNAYDKNSVEAERTKE